MSRLRPKLSFANAIALIALFVSLGGTVYAAAKINGKTIKKESIPANRLKADSLGGAQVNEAALAQVPSAARAGEATKAGEAARAGQAARADFAERAGEATEAGVAKDVTRAARAREADRAATAFSAESAGEAAALSTVPASDFLSRCAPGTVKAAVTVESETTIPPTTRVVRPFNCLGNGNKTTVSRIGVGEYRITTEGFVGGFGIATSGENFVASVLPQGATGVYRVVTYAPIADIRSDGGDFTFAVF